ncbi:DHH family phosphoesterase [Gordonia soli]|uniref:DHH family protein n=1 Tax=Gordonia soli NBRC 108243 TaxID=1223545 RepID=M0QS58_9ACTN|nr:bifunctional oligoribonuclease/PAP phosphatase NrnA [Gordonia soli]GAC70872.1 DHH family protein [Gordonia soli NBRC 108243]
MTAADSAAIAAALTGAPAVTILCHVRPDADTIGSGLALGLALDRRGVDVEVAYPGDERLPCALASLPGAKLLVRETELTGHRVVVSVDAANLGRLSSLGDVFSAAEVGIAVDHHASNPGFGDLDLIDADSDCTAVLVLRILDAMQVDVDVDIATCLYAGLLTDTGSFKWARPDSFRVAARLLEAGVDGRMWSRILIDTHPFSWFSMVSRVLDSATLVPAACNGEGLVYAVVDRTAMAGMSWDESESVVDIVRTASEAEIAAVFKESEPGEWTVSLRSKSTVDVMLIARSHGGGGHRHASGYSAAGSADEVVAELVDDL